MRKFTIFTIILTVIIVVVASEVSLTDYLPKFNSGNTVNLDKVPLPDNLNVGQSGQTNVLGADIDYSKIPQETPSTDIPVEVPDIPFNSDSIPVDTLPLEISNDVISDLEYEETPLDGSSTNDFIDPNEMLIPSDSSNSDSDFEDENFSSSFSGDAYLREDMVLSAGFNATVETEPHNGFLFKTIYIDDLYDTKATKYLIKSGNTLLAKVYVFTIGPLSSTNDIYDVLKVRASEGSDIKINETNEFGEASFYMNDSSRQNVAFLTVRFGSLIYGFSYPKEYHSQIINLISLIDQEF